MYSTRYSCQILMKLELPAYFRKKSQISDFMKIRPVGAEMFNADERMDGRTDMTKLMVAFCNFSNASKNDICNSFNIKYYFNDTFKHKMENEWKMRFPVPAVLSINNTVF